MNGNTIKARDMRTALALLVLEVREKKASVRRERVKRIVATCRGSLKEVIRGIVPIVQSAQRNDGERRSQTLTETK